MKISDAISYNPNTGLLYWKVSRSNVKAGDVAGCISKKDGYWRVYFKGKSYLSHRVAFYLMKSRWPTEIDHVNRIKSDNRWSNLKECTHSENMKNMDKRIYKHIKNKFGHKGIIETKYSTFEVYAPKKKYLGSSKTLEGAIEISKSFYDGYV